MNPEEITEQIRMMAPQYGEAKAKRTYLEEFKSVKKALLMKEALALKIETAAAQEREAKADPEYNDLLKGLAAAIEKEETLRWTLEAYRMDVEVWKTRSYINRMVDKAHE